MTAVIAIAASLLNFIATPSKAEVLNTDPNVCNASISSEENNSSPIVLNNVDWQAIGAAQGNDLHTDESTDLYYGNYGSPSGGGKDSGGLRIPLPFGQLANGNANLYGQINPNGGVGLGDGSYDQWGNPLDYSLQSRSQYFDLFNTDLQSIDTNTWQPTGDIYYGACRMNLDGVDHDGWAVTWMNAAIRDQYNYVPLSQTVTMQIIFVQLDATNFQVFRNYQSLQDGGANENIPRDTWRGVVTGSDVDPNNFMAGSGGYFNSSMTTELSDDGTSPLSGNHSLGTSQTGRYLGTTQFQSGIGQACDPSVTTGLQVSYSAPGVEGVDPSYQNVKTETFDQFGSDPGSIPDGYQDSIGTWNSSSYFDPTHPASGNYLHEAGRYWGAGGNGDGAVMNGETLTAPVGTCYKYLGFWWAAGSPGNNVELLDSSGNVVAAFTATDLYNAIKADPLSNTPPCPDSNNEYCGRTGSTNPNGDGNDPEEPWAYVNLHFNGGFSTVRFSQSDTTWGFEIDNVSLSEEAQAINASDHVLSGVAGPCDPNANATLSVTYSAPGVQSVDESFGAMHTETFNEFENDQMLPSPYQTQVGTWTGQLAMGSPNLYGAAEYTGKYGSAMNETVTAPAGTCYKYMGFWWSAGNPDNHVELLDSIGNVLATFNAADLEAALNTTNDPYGVCGDPNLTPTNPYCGNPAARAYFSTNPPAPEGNFDDTWEPFAYVNLRFPAGFSAIRLFGAGFEMDNLSVSAVLPGASQTETSLPGPTPSASPSDSSSPTPSDTPTPSATPSASPSASPSPKPQILGLSVAMAGTNTFIRPDPPTKQFLNGPMTNGDEGWFICDSQHSSASDYELGAFPGDCRFTSNRDPVYTPSSADRGKYVAYGAWQQNAVGATYAIQTSSTQIGDVSIVGLANTGPLHVSSFNILGNAASSTALWYRCDNPATSPWALPIGCVATTTSSLNYSATPADIGKYMVYGVTATGADTGNTYTMVADGGASVTVGQLLSQYISDFIVSILRDLSGANATGITTSGGATQGGGQWWICTSPSEHYAASLYNQNSVPAVSDTYALMQANEGCSPVTGQYDPNLVPMNLNYDGKYLAYATTASTASVFFIKVHSALVTLPTPTPSATAAPMPTPSASASASPTPSATASPTSSPTNSATATPSPTPSATAAPTSTPSASASASPSHSSSPSASASAIVIGPSPSPSESMSDAVIVVGPTPTTGEVTTTKVIDPITQVAKSIESAAKVVTNILVPQADPAIGATGDDNEPTVAFVPTQSKQSTNRYLAIAAWFVVLLVSSVFGAMRRSRRENALGSIVETDAHIHYRKQNRKAWGDRLPWFQFTWMTALDRFSYSAIRVTYPRSPMLGKIFSEGAYLRAFFGSLTSLGAVAAIGLGLLAALSRDYSSVMPSIYLLLAIVLLGIFDAFAGLLASFTLVTSTLMTSSGLLLNDYRTLIGLFVLGFTPALAAEAFRSVRRPSEKTGAYRWERLSDAAISPFIAGLTAAAMVSVLPALAGKTLAVANHVLEFGLLVAAAMLLRVLLEEFAAKAFPQRMDKLNPEHLREPSKLQQFYSILFKLAVYIFVSTAIFGLTWEVWLACLFFVAPALIKLFEDKLPNFRALWLLLPKGIPGMALNLVLTLLIITDLVWILQKPEQIARYGFIVLGVFALAITMLHALGRHGRADELRPLQIPERKAIYRIGGVLMYVLTVGLAIYAA